MTCFRMTLAVLALSAMTAIAPAQDFTAGGIKVSKAWTREVPAGAKVAAGFMTITNSGKEADTLIGGSIPLAGNVESLNVSVAAAVLLYEARRQRSNV